MLTCIFVYPFLAEPAGKARSEGFKVHDFEYLLRSKKLHFEIEIEFMSLEMCHLLLTSKNIRKRAQICADVVLEYFAMLEV